MNLRIRSLCRFASRLLISLPNETHPKFKGVDEPDVEHEILAEFFASLRARAIKCIVLDEAQRDLRLVEFLIKSNHQTTCQIVISGTPPCGFNMVDYGGSISARVVSVPFGTLRGYEVRCLLQALFDENDLSSGCWLDFWTVFNGEPGMYQELAQILGECGSEQKSKIADEGISSIFESARALHQKYRNVRFGMSEALMTTIGVQRSRRDIGKKDVSTQKHIEDLLYKKILISMPSLTQFKSRHQNRAKMANNWKTQQGSIVAWKDPYVKARMRNGDQIELHSFPLLRGFGLEDLIADLFEWHFTVGTDLEQELGIPCVGSDILFLDYEGGTDADLLLVQENASIDRVFMFNIKTHPNLLLDDSGNRSKLKFETLCDDFKDFEVILILLVEDFKGVDPNLIYETWKDVKNCTLHKRVYSLSDFAQIAPKIPITRRDAKLFVNRPLEENAIKEGLELGVHDVAIQGRYRVGKSHLLSEMARQNDGWVYRELDAS